MHSRPSRPGVRFGREYNYLVKVKTSITLPEELLQAIDQTDPNRSSFIEKAARQYLAALAKSRREAQDAEILNARAESLNREALDVLEYQDLVWVELRCSAVDCTGPQAGVARS